MFQLAAGQGEIGHRLQYLAAGIEHLPGGEQHLDQADFAGAIGGGGQALVFFEALQDRLIERKSPLPIVFITGHGDVPMAVDTMKKGALDFIQKPFDESALVSVVERMLEHARTAFTDQQQAATREALLAKLTGRESQVLERIVAGRLNKQIADDLGISIKTVEAHRANIMEKMGANTVADLLKVALGSAHNATA